MKKIINQWQWPFLLSVLFAAQANAIGISSMLEYADEQGRTVFTVSNGESYRQYINTAVSELTVVNGEIKKMPYTRDNIDKWALDIRPARTILEPGFKKDIVVQYQPKEIVRSDRDRVFQLSFVPTPYFAEGEEKQQVKIAFGFAPLLIVPAKKTQPLAYELRYQGDSVIVTNKGDGFFSLSLDGCAKDAPANARQECSTSATVLAGRKLTVKLPNEMVKAQTLRAKLFSYGNKFKAEETLSKQS
ncbi:TPA: hypothetical protein P2Q98_004561 [Aeromonas veronii]|uniref:hypothetical protein n=1 Tax=Aeromonas veronii TaxID=654 RepID=UPI0033123C8E|nr:hypothetical protein [Aeromonas veronii]HDO1336286.1 hypothetical protein [Aeromonas veronii]HDO1340819.1 hypothetical protein [Aeromonas veronii]HDO1345334.1 hypothetical protein [Aeromonas veronii]HDO1349909.1 hypothetical protein [Aeromonas veronii]